MISKSPEEAQSSAACGACGQDPVLLDFADLLRDRREAIIVLNDADHRLRVTSHGG